MRQCISPSDALDIKLWLLKTGRRRINKTATRTSLADIRASDVAYFSWLGDTDMYLQVNSIR